MFYAKEEQPKMTKTKKVQLVVRTYPSSYEFTTENLESALNIGYKVVMVNPIGICLEYILEKEVEERV